MDKKAKVRVYSRLRTVSGEDVTSFRSNSKMGRSSGRISSVRSYGGLLGFDGEHIDFEWKIFPGFSSLQILQESRVICKKRNIELRNSLIGSSSCQCSTILIGQEKER